MPTRTRKLHNAATQVRDMLNPAGVMIRDKNAEIARLRTAIKRAHEQLGKYGQKGPKQVGRAMNTLETAMPELYVHLMEEKQPYKEEIDAN